MFENELILVSAVAGDIGAGAVRSLSETGIRIIGCDMKEYSPIIPLLTKFYKIPSANNVDEYFTSLEACIKNEKVTCFLPISEAEIAVLNANRQRMLSLGVKVLINNELILDNFLNKLSTINFLKQYNIKVPNSTLLKDFDYSFDFPVIVKALEGCGSKRLWVAHDNDDLSYLKTKDKDDLIVQDYLGSDDFEFTTGVFSDGHNVSIISFRRKLGFGGLSIEAILVDEPKLDQLAIKIARITNLKGSINIQTRLSKGEFIPFEINPRISSTLSFRKKFGFDDVVWWLEVILGKSYNYCKKYSSGRAIRYTSEMYFDMKEISTI
ncbi:MAG: ATP-grasp domain-containing protein [Desulfotalea sp.]